MIIFLDKYCTFSLAIDLKSKWAYKKRMIILYDANCDICCKIKEALIKIDFDNRFNFTPISDHQIYDQYEKVNYWDARKTIHIIDDEGNVYKSEYAVIKILDQIRLLSKLNPLLTSKIGIQVTAQAYKLLNNYRLKKIQDCTDCNP